MYFVNISNNDVDLDWNNSSMQMQIHFTVGLLSIHVKIDEIQAKQIRKADNFHDLNIEQIKQVVCWNQIN